MNALPIIEIKCGSDASCGTFDGINYSGHTLAKLVITGKVRIRTTGSRITDRKKDRKKES